MLSYGTDATGLVALLAAEQAALGGQLAGLDDGDWEMITPARGWRVRDQVAHLADTEEVARDTLVDGARSFRRAVAGFRDPEAFTAAGCRRADGLDGPALLQWWHEAAEAARRALLSTPVGLRVPWGLGMGLDDFACARLMEHWAHGEDVRAALGLPPVTDRALRPVAELGLRTLRFAFVRARVTAPAGRTLLLDLRHGDQRLALGDPAASDVVSGDLRAWCRVVVRRASTADQTRLRATGPLASLALDHARAYL